jgi:hypothetical protein
VIVAPDMYEWISVSIIRKDKNNVGNKDAPLGLVVYDTILWVYCPVVRSAIYIIYGSVDSCVNSIYPADVLWHMDQPFRLQPGTVQLYRYRMDPRKYLSWSS